MQKNLITNKYPRTFHLPFSPGRGKDDKVAKNINNIFEKDIIITEKLDGSNVCLETNICYARSHSHPPTHKSFDIVKSIHSNIKHLIPENYQVFCENLFAKHSIYYSNLISCLFILGIRDIEKSVWLSVEENILWSNELNIAIVPILFDGKINCEKHL